MRSILRTVLLGVVWALAIGGAYNLCQAVWGYMP